jgi:CubicO group peptidase (beta-lactamase class C family)
MRITMPASLLLAFALGGCASGGGTMQSSVDALMRDYSGDVPGAAVLVLRDGEPLVRRGYGLADLEAGLAVGPETGFRLASVSKQFTAAAIVLLAQDGKLSLDDPVRKWLPSLPDVAEPITLRHLLTHSAGLVDYEDLMAPEAPGAPDQATPEQIHDIDVLHLLEREHRLYFAPGTGYRYSNGGYALLALVVGKASGRDFATFLRERIFQPLGMSHTVAYENGISTVANRAYGHSLADGEWVRTDQSSTSAVLGDGGIYSSIDDLAKWDAALYDDRLLSDASRADAFALHTPIHDEADVDGYGYGWRIHGEVLWHSGETMGFRNVIVRWPARHFTVVVLTNRNAPEPYRLALEIAGLYLSKAPRTP